MAYENKETADFIKEAEALAESLQHKPIERRSTFLANSLLDAYNLGFDEAVILIGKQTKKLGG